MAKMAWLSQERIKGEERLNNLKNNSPNEEEKLILQLEIANNRIEFLEECIVEMASIVYEPN